MPETRLDSRHSDQKGSPLPATDPGLRRVSVHSGTTAADVALPAGIPVALLTPSIVDLLDAGDARIAGRYHLSLPGSAALDPSKTLAQSGIADGDILLLSRPSAPPPATRHHDVAEAVSGALIVDSGAGVRRRTAARLAGAIAGNCLTAVGVLALATNAVGARDAPATVGVATGAALVALLCAAVAQRVYRDAGAGLALSAIAAAFAAVAGFLAVPGRPGVSHLLLAATAAAATCVLAARSAGRFVVALTAASCVATVVAVAALAGVLTAGPPHAIGAVSALVSLGALGCAARISVVLAGLSPRLPPTPDADETAADEARVAGQTLRADAWLSSLLAGFSSSAAVGAAVTVVAGAPRLSCMAFGGITGALLLLRARCADSRRIPAFVVTGMAVIGTTFGVAAFGSPGRGPWVAVATATLAAAAMYLGFAAPAISLPPLARRTAEALEWLALAALVPLTFWICGLYGTVRGLSVP
ncbi:type VII secretion integral membrane protein EccD [Mycobacterium europaeum]|uniref:type VII secretion integral membrane protein EccD n=1 Tax=Mycobacterium europaeum TaxID=761804 RepID=UPI000A15FB7C|nr:type VII secretion integral membrane protein EccD [Mycobacterium europaeum]ORV53696.1 type VII secretion integral membrane protein EccD [Mycobacterium europaeum]